MGRVMCASRTINVLAARQRASGPPADRTTQATLGRRAETEGPFEVLVAYPHSGPTLARAAKAAAGNERVAWSVLVEDERGAARALDAGDRAGADLGVFLDVNCGMDRTGVPLADALDVARRTLAAAGERLRGLHMYEGRVENASVGPGFATTVRARARRRRTDRPRSD